MMKKLLISIKLLIKSCYPDINIKGKVIKSQWYEALKFIIKHADGVEQSFYIFFNGNEMMIISPRPSYFQMCRVDAWKSSILKMMYNLLESKKYTTFKICNNGHDCNVYFYNYCPICGTPVINYTRYINHLKCCQCCHETCEIGILGEDDDGLLFSVYCAGCYEIQGDVYTTPFEALNEYRKFNKL